MPCSLFRDDIAGLNIDDCSYVFMLCGPDQVMLDECQSRRTLGVGGQVARMLGLQKGNELGLAGLLEGDGSKEDGRVGAVEATDDVPGAPELGSGELGERVGFIGS